MRRFPPTDLTPGRARGFTLIELIFVMALLAIAASFVAPRMTSFFRGRALSLEAQRMLSLTHYGQSRAVAEGVPVVMWIDTRNSSYGLSVQAGYTDTDEQSRTYVAESTLTLETPQADQAPVSELGDEKLGLAEGLTAIRFLPDGDIDEGSVSRVVIRQGTEAALELVPMTNRMGYEIRPYTEP